MVEYKYAYEWNKKKKQIKINAIKFATLEILIGSRST